MPEMPTAWLTITALWALFFVYSFCGWVIESTYCSVPARRFINRGFLNGPYIPIYGTGAMIAGVLLSGLAEHPLALFVVSATLSCALEYATSWLMERIYHARWWDYSERPLNLDGRVWVGGFLEFGAVCELVVLVAHPVLLEAVESAPAWALTVFSLVTATVFAIDLWVTHTGITGLRANMDYLRAGTEKGLATLREQLPDLPSPPDMSDLGIVHAFDELVQHPVRERLEVAGRRVRGVTDQIHLPQVPSLEELGEAFSARLSSQERRILRAFPEMRPSHYRSLIGDFARELRSRGPRNHTDE